MKKFKSIFGIFILGLVSSVSAHMMDYDDMMNGYGMYSLGIFGLIIPLLIVIILVLLIIILTRKVQDKGKSKISKR